MPKERVDVLAYKQGLFDTFLTIFIYQNNYV